MSPAAVETTRREWEESAARLEGAAADREMYLRLLEQVDLVVAELRKRVGQTFTLAELAEAYGDAEQDRPKPARAAARAAPPRARRAGHGR